MKSTQVRRPLIDWNWSTAHESKQPVCVFTEVVTRQTIQRLYDKALTNNHYSGSLPLDMFGDVFGQEDQDLLKRSLEVIYNLEAPLTTSEAIRRLHHYLNAHNRRTPFKKDSAQRPDKKIKLQPGQWKIEKLNSPLKTNVKGNT